MNWLNRTKRGYTYDKRIFWFVIMFTVVAVMYVFWNNNFDFTPNLYFECHSARCENPFFLSECKQRLTVLFFIPLYTSQDCSIEPEYWWLQERFLPKGTYGTPPPNDFFYTHIKKIVFLVFAMALLLNHLVHNKGVPFDIEIPITKKLIINRDWLEERKRRLDDEERKNNSGE